MGSARARWPRTKPVASSSACRWRPSVWALPTRCWRCRRWPARSAISTPEAERVARYTRRTVPLAERSYTTIEVSRRLGVSLQTVQRWVDSGHLKAWKTLGGHRRIDAASAERLFAERAAGAAPVVVVIDNQPGAREELVELVRQALPDAQVAAVEDGFRGLVAIGRAAPDIVVTDIQVAHMDGFEMLRSLVGASGPQPPAFIAVTALSDAELAALGPLPGQVLLFQKPPDPGRFIAALQDSASRVQARDEAAVGASAAETRKPRGRHVRKSG
ncbi:hypothetical protein CKO44_15660 [Rubrivivax gelatinosus]|nr:hypothetical protein [Rubrivivax gelatinosus]